MSSLEVKPAPDNTSLERTSTQIEYHQPWYSTAIFSLLINIVAGLLVAGIILLAKTPSGILLSIAILAVLALVASAVTLVLQNKRLVLESRELKESLRSCDLRYDQQLRHIGVTEIAETLGGSRWSPDAVMQRAQRQVRFLGVFGHKWVMDAPRRESFRSMLTHIQLNGGTVQFLLLDPDGSAATQVANYRKQNSDAYKNFHSIEFYKSLSAQFDCFEIRLFDHLPFLRLIFVDGLCAISRFNVAGGADETLKAPQLAFGPERPGGTWTLYQAFVLLYDFLWARARNPFATSTELADLLSDTMHESTMPVVDQKAETKNL